MLTQLTRICILGYDEDWVRQFLQRTQKVNLPEAAPVHFTHHIKRLQQKTDLLLRTR